MAYLNESLYKQIQRLNSRLTHSSLIKNFKNLLCTRHYASYQRFKEGQNEVCALKDLTFSCDDSLVD